MIATIHPSTLQGRLRVPASKSAMQRALAASMIRKGRTVIWNPGQSADDLAALRCIRALGAQVELQDHHWVVDGKGVQPMQEVLDCGESGLSIRMFTPLAALSDMSMQVTGGGSLSNRPMHFFENILPKLGVDIQLQSGRLPIRIKGPLRPSNVSVDGSLSSQFLTGLLMAYAASDAKDVCIEVHDLKSRPYIDLTLQTLHRFGLPVPRNEQYQRFVFTGDKPNEIADPLEISIEGDWSGAAFWLAAAPFATGIELEGLDAHSLQADRSMLSLFDDPNSMMMKSGTGLFMQSHRPAPFEFDATDCPDLFPPLVALAAHTPGVSFIHGVHRLAHKESDRAQALCSEFAKLGLSVQISGDAMRVEGGAGLTGGLVSSHGDHRIAMSLAIAALKANGPVQIDGAESVHKSYPAFWDDLKSLGAALSLSN